MLAGEVRDGDRPLLAGQTLCERRLFEVGSLAQPEAVMGAQDGALLTLAREVLPDEIERD